MGLVGSGLKIFFDERESTLIGRLNGREFVRILSNIINNSVESFESPSGEIRLGCDVSGQHLAIWISDTGKGIPSAVLPILSQRQFSHGK